MKYRVQAGTDMAAIGAWDASVSDTVLYEVWGVAQDKILEQDASEGLLFFVRIGADWGGPIDVYVDEELPDEIRKDLKQVGGEFLLSVATGQLVINGVEFYRTGRAGEVLIDNAVKIPSGDYGLRFFESKSEVGIDPPSKKDLENLVGKKDSTWFRRLQWSVLAMYLVLPALFFVVRHFRGWKIALLTALGAAGVACVFFSMIKSMSRFKRVAKAQFDLWRQAQDREKPVFVFVLRRKLDGEVLKGGSVNLRKTTS